jgi:Fe2+ or Zn2+ uptake regulation protein
MTDDFVELNLKGKRKVRTATAYRRWMVLCFFRGRTSYDYTTSWTVSEIAECVASDYCPINTNQVRSALKWLEKHRLVRRERQSSTFHLWSISAHGIEMVMR